MTSTCSSSSSSANATLNEWENIQLQLRCKVIRTNTEDWENELDQENPSLLHYVGGLDVSFVKNSNSACVGLVVTDVQDGHNIVYEDYSTVEITEEYISGFLSFREVNFYTDLLKKMKTSNPDMYPQCLLIDGNGYLHARRFGLACHVGVVCDIPTIGVAKKLYRIDDWTDDTHKQKVVEKLKREGDSFELKTDEGDVLGCCLRNKGTKPIYISVGHKISLETAVRVVKLTSPKYRIPEPIRLADIKTREIIRNQIKCMN